MQPSSLIFVVVIGIWAAFLLQYWVRRREHLATARSIDRFSEAMRVLDRRTGAASMSTGGDRSGQPRAGAPPSPEPAGGEGSSPLLCGPRRPSPLVARGGRPHPASPPTSGATLAAARRGPSPAARRARALGLLLALAVVPVTVAAVALGRAPSWTLAVAVAELSLCLVALRLAAVKAQTARRTDRSMRSTEGRRRDLPTPVAPDTHPGQRASAGAGQDAVQDGEERPADASEPASPAYRPGDPTWRPVPVPRPTYQLKDPAPVRRVRSPQRPFDGQEPAQPADSSGTSPRRVRSG